ncbi:MAG: PQQ-dependent dehydrogenase, methanol/ethanol family, partial [Acidobacteria bacterium]|nr:PQQ-dependent dehydrogenase, methanol/ethanol family [Acidobacteriota bacterium]
MIASIVIFVSFNCLESFAQVSYQRLLRAESEPANWLTYSGSYRSQRYSPLNQVNTQNVNQLKQAWVYQIRQAGVVESTPLVADGVMYITEPVRAVTALDVRTGRPLWTYSP